MTALASVDAKIGRGRTELRLLKADIAAFCEEKARLIVREPDPEDEEMERWVYRGDRPQPPIEWSIRAGEFAYNLRSALDHLVWQLVEVNGGKPSNSNAFPIYNPIYEDSPTDKEIEHRLRRAIGCRLRGVSPCAKHYIKSVQPYKNDHAGIGKGLQLLNDMCNIDKHRHLVVANVRWTGYWPKVITSANFPMPYIDSNTYLTDSQYYLCNYDLENDQAILTTKIKGLHLVIPVDAFFTDPELQDEGAGNGTLVTDTLNACIDSVEMVVSALRSKF